MRKISVKLRITLWYTLSMIIIVSVAFVAITSFGQNMMRRDMEERITKSVMGMSMQITNRDGKLRPVPEFMFYERGVHMALYDGEYNLIGGQIPFGITAELDFDNEELREKTYDGNRYLELDRKVVTHSGETYWVKGIISVEDESAAGQTTAKNNFILMLIFVLASAIGGYFVISRALVPVGKISRTANNISESSDLSQRINIGKGGDEISSLANTFDKMLDKIEQTLENEKQFTSDASHELRTPVAVIISECEYMLECAKASEDFKESAASVKRQAEKMSKLISELLMISRMDKKTQEMNFEETDISELLNFVCDEQEEIRDKNRELIRNIEPDILAVTDRMQLARVFINIISNAYQYSDEDSVIKVELQKSNGKIRFSVEDNGIGIPKDDLPKIWERFYQVEESRTARESGSMGLGLSMVKQIADALGGTLSVESELGAGSKFVFEF